MRLTSVELVLRLSKDLSKPMYWHESKGPVGLWEQKVKNGGRLKSDKDLSFPIDYKNEEGEWE